MDAYKVKWMGKVPEHCDICKASIQRCFVDAPTRYGQWAIMCPSCRIEEGAEKLGTGYGQKYEKHGMGDDAVWYKTGG